MTIDFDNEEQYQKFVKDVAISIYHYRSYEFAEDVAGYVVDEIMKYHRYDLADAIIARLLKEYAEENHQ